MTRARIYSENQKVILRQLRILHEEHVTARKELRQKIEEEYEQRLSDYEFQESRLMNKALRTLGPTGKGIAKTDIGRAVGLANWLVLESKYALTADEFGEILTENDPTFWVKDGNRIHLTKFNEYVVDIWVFLTNGEADIDPKDIEKADGPILLPLLSTDYAQDWLALLAKFKEELSA